MPAHLLAWNPNAYPAELVMEIRDDVLASKQQGMNWSVGNIKNIEPGSRFFMVRLGVAPKGIVAAGRITRSPERRPHYDEDLAKGGATLNFVELSFDTINITPVISWEELHRGTLSGVSWSIRQSGPRLPDDVAAELERVWSERAGIPAPPEDPEVAEGATYYEGAVVQRLVNRYERDPKARAACLAHYGYECQACRISGAFTYGPEGADLIEVHHRVPLSQVGVGYVVDPIKDLVPVCPNCHAMIHRGSTTRSVEDVIAMIEAQDDLNGITEESEE